MRFIARIVGSQFIASVVLTARFIAHIVGAQFIAPVLLTVRFIAHIVGAQFIAPVWQFIAPAPVVTSGGISLCSI